MACSGVAHMFIRDVFPTELSPKMITLRSTFLRALAMFMRWNSELRYYFMLSDCVNDTYIHA